MHRLLRLQQLAHAAGSSCQVQGSKVPLKVQAPLQGGVPVGSMAKAKVHGVAETKCTWLKGLACACHVQDITIRRCLGDAAPLLAQADAHFPCRPT